jgi:6-phosphofructokinase
LASGVCNAVLVPEAPFVLERVAQHVGELLRDQRQRNVMPHAILLIAETAIPSEPERYLTDEEIGLNAAERGAIEEFLRHDRRVRGQTPDALRAASMKVVTKVLEREIRREGGYWESFRVFSNEPRHLIRAMAPSASDVVFGQRLGANAVDAAMAGFHDCMVSHWLTEFVLVPLALVVLGRKRLPLTGAFWKAVLASTGQPDFGALVQNP